MYLLQPDFNIVASSSMQHFPFRLFRYRWDSVSLKVNISYLSTGFSPERCIKQTSAWKPYDQLNKHHVNDTTTDFSVLVEAQQFWLNSRSFKTTPFNFFIGWKIASTPNYSRIEYTPETWRFFRRIASWLMRFSVEWNVSTTQNNESFAHSMFCI